MKTISNPSGKGALAEEHDLSGAMFCACSGCMSLYAEFLSWANASSNRGRVVKDADSADNIVLLCCQVTDLAVLNDLRIAERYRLINPKAKIFISGCLARRFDIQLPIWLNRLDNLCRNGTFIDDRGLVNYEPPFWVEGFKEAAGETEDGHLFRNMYPFRIGVGCHGKCSYCTIRYTRGLPYEIESMQEFKQADNMVLTADSPTADQLVFWMQAAREHKKTISIRNVEPQVANTIWSEIVSFAETGLLSIFHCPVQASSPQALRAMGRNTSITAEMIRKIKRLNGVTTATNVIRDYKDFPNDFDAIYEAFDYVSWNPYWDGNWTANEAEKRFSKYFAWA